MGVRDRVSGYTDKLPQFRDGESESSDSDSRIEIYEPTARTLTTNVILGVGGAGIIGLIGVEIGLLPAAVVEWGVLGVTLALMMANPVVELESVWEAAVILLMYLNFIGYLIVYHSGTVENAVLISVVVLLVILVFEFPRRFGG